MATKRKASKGHPAHIGFQALADKVAAEYRAKGVDAETAKRYGEETAGKVYREQLAKGKARPKKGGAAKAARAAKRK